jgi:ATP-binding cassette, subfamily C (CFTR/MRP), member 1
VAAVILAIVWLILVVLYSLRDKDTTRTSVPSAILGFVAAIAIFVLSHVEHKRSVRPSALLNMYLFFSVLFDAVQLRSLVLSEGSSLVSRFFATNVGVKVVLLVLEAWEKRKSLADAYANLPLESTIGIFNRTFFWWLNATLLRGSRASLSPEDLQKIDTALEPRVWAKALQEAWIRHSIPNASRRALVSASIKAFRKPLAAMVFPRICLIGLNFAQPFLISRLLNLLRDPDSMNNRNIGYGLIGATGAIYLGIAVLNGWYKHQLFRCITSFRGAMIAFIFNRALHLPDGVYNESKAVSLMGTDIDRICVSIERVHEVWAQLLEVLIGVSLLGLQLGWICVLPVAIVLGSTILNSKVATTVPAKQKIWAAAVQKRIAITTSAIGSMKTIRMAGLTRAVTRILVEQRIRELRLMAGFRWMSLWLNSIANIPTAFCAAVTFTAYVVQAHIEGREGLDVTRAFTSMALINLVAVPAGRFLTAFPVLTASLGCFERVQEYMLAPSRADSRILSRTMENAVELDRVKFATNNDTRTSPTNITLSLRRGALNIITGPVGAGKTTLAKALLGEIACEAGTICVYTTKVGYCAQTPWLLNLSIRQNICGLRTNSLFDDDWYQTVLQACALDVDMKHLVEGDETMIGSKGTKLSGGQRHRVALARCVFACPEIVVLDDVFSALDSETEQIVTERLLGPSGLLRRLNSTIILISHSGKLSTRRCFVEYL